MLAIGSVAAETTTYEYDAAGRLRVVTYENGQTTTYSLDAAGNRSQVVTTPPPVQLSVAAASATEGSPIVFTVTRVSGPPDTVSVTCTPSSGTATIGADFTAPNPATVLTFTPADTMKTCQVPTVSDSIYEGNEAFTLALTNPTGSVFVSSGPAAGTIVDAQQPPAFSISSASASENNGSIALTVTMSGLSAFTHTVIAATSAGTAVSPADFAANTDLLSFPPGQTSQSFIVALADDAVYEGNETFSATLWEPTGGATIATLTATATIIENDAPPSFTISDASAGETGTCYPPEPGFPDTGYCDPSYFQFTITKSGATALSHAVTSSTANGSALGSLTGTGDFTPDSQTHTFAPGETSRPFLVTITPDTVYEGNETLNVQLSAPTNAATISDGAAVGTIIDDDSPVPGTLRFTGSTATVNEAGGSIALAVSRTGGSDLTASVVCSTSNASAVAGSDYTAVTQTLTWAHGDGSNKNCTIPIVDDSTYEGNETFNVSLSSPSNATISSPSSAVVTIIENDSVPPAGTLQLSSASYAATETSGNVTITVTRLGGSFGAVSVNYATSNGSGVAGTDYTAASGTLSWPNADASNRTFTVPVLNDNTHDGTKTVNLALSGVSGTTIGSPGSAVLTITDVQSPPVFSVGNSTANEGGPIGFSVFKSGNSSFTHQVNYATASGSATQGVDYTGASGTLVFAPGQVAQSVVLSTATDSLTEGDETFTLSLSNATNGASISTPTAVGTIIDIPPALPAPPTNFGFTWVNNPRVFTVSWNASSGASYYELVETGDIDGNPVGPTTYTQTATSKGFTRNATAGWTYNVRACNASNQCGAYTIPPVSVGTCSTIDCPP